MVLRATVSNSRRVRVYRGDGGVDVYAGTYGADGEADVFQIKHFPAQWRDTQKQQIRDAYQMACTQQDYRLGVWTLCVPVRLTKEDLRWFDEWRSKQDHKIELLDGDDLTERLQRDECAQARQQLRAWGVQGFAPGGPRFAAFAIVRPEDYQKSGLSAVLVVQLRNDGDRSAKALKATIEHSDTGCVAYAAPLDWKQSPDDGSLNPRRLRHEHVLNPGDRAVVMGIPICERTEFPFTVSISLSAEDAVPQDLCCRIERADTAHGKVLQFIARGEAVAKIAPGTQPPRRRPSPNSPAAKELFGMIMAHPASDERGLSHFLKGMGGRYTETYFVPHTKARGTSVAMKTTVFAAAVAELVQLGWLLPPQGDSKVHIYEFSPEEDDGTV